MAKSSGGGASGSGGRGGGSIASRVIGRGAALGHSLSIGKGGSIFNNGKKTNMSIVNGKVTHTSGKRKGQPVLGWGDV